MKNDSPESLMRKVETISEHVYQMLCAGEQDLELILNQMRERDQCLDTLIPYLEGNQKHKWILVLCMIRDKEAAALMPYREELTRVESALMSLKHCQAYFVLNGMGAGGATGA